MNDNIVFQLLCITTTSKEEEEEEEAEGREKKDENQKHQLERQRYSVTVPNRTHSPTPNNCSRTQVCTIEHQQIDNKITNPNSSQMRWNTTTLADSVKSNGYVYVYKQRRHRQQEKEATANIQDVDIELTRTDHYQHP